MLSYFNKLNESVQNMFLQFLKTFFEKKKEEERPQSLEEYTRELEEASREIESGNFILHEDVLKYFNKEK